MKKINNLIILIMLIGSVYCFFNYFSNDIAYKAICISIIPISLLPKMVRHCSKFKITDLLELLYLLFIFFAQFLGSVVGMYQCVYFYDKIMHLISGFLSAFLALIVLIYMHNYQEKNVFFNVIFIVSFILLIASFWEFFEYFSDKIFKGDAQNVLSTCVGDTMEDMLFALSGSILFIGLYLFEHITKNKLFITRFIEDIEKV